MRPPASIGFAVMALLAAGAVVSAVLGPTPLGMESSAAEMPGMGSSTNLTPPVKGFAKGRELTFIHTEVSDPQVAATLTRMMGPKVLVVPNLNEIPDRLLASVFVFRNGVKGEGPMGYQPDVFDTVPGDSGYTPLRRLVLVAWKEERRARVLRSAVEIRQAAQQDTVQLTRPGIVVNMPMLTWPGGQR